jgi:hypothetical protein
MQVRDGGPKLWHSATCDRLATNDGGDYGPSRPGGPIDHFVSQWALTALAPAALTLALEAADRVEQERRDLARRWPPRLERATSEAARAARHDQSIAPAHRLVARPLAKDGEAKLMAQQRRHAEYHHFVPEHPRALSVAERDALSALAQDLPALGHAPATTLADRQERRRPSIDRVIVAGEGTSERLQIAIKWIGGGTTAGRTTRPISRIEHLSDSPQLCDRLRPLAQAGCSAAQIAERLECEGYRPPRQAVRVRGQAVHALMPRLGVVQRRTRRRPPLGEHAWGLADGQRLVGIPQSTLHAWRQHGWLQPRWDTPTKRWSVWADTAERERLQQQHALPVGYHRRQRWRDAAPDQSPAPHRAVTAYDQERESDEVARRGPTMHTRQHDG